MHTRPRFTDTFLALAAAAVLTLTAAPAASANHALFDLLSVGSAGGGAAVDASFRGSSQDGTRIFFETTESLVAADTDTVTDVYERSGGATSLVSTGSTGGNGAIGAAFAGSSADGTRVFFATNEALTAADGDSSRDVYERSGGSTTLVSTGPNGGNAATTATFAGASQTGTRVFFTTLESLVSADTDSARDIYERSGGTTTLLSTGPSGGNGNFNATFKGSSQDGTRVFFQTMESLVSADTDTETDVYQRSGSTTTWLSTGPIGGNGGGEEFYDAAFVGASADGSRVFIETDETLVSSDVDMAVDVYERSGSTTTLLSLGPAGGNEELNASFRGSSQDGSRVFMETAEPLVVADGDERNDVYEAAGGVVTLISTGPSDGGGFDAGFAGATPDGSRVYFRTALSLVLEDLDLGWTDVYERAGGSTKLISIGPTGGSAPLNAQFRAVSQDGSRVFFQSDEGLVGPDIDGGFPDVFERFSDTTTLLSAGLLGGNNPYFASFAAASTDGTRVLFTTAEPLLATDTDLSGDIYSVAVPAGFPRPQGAVQARTPLVVAYEQCNAPGNNTHQGGLAHPSCQPPSQSSSFLTVGTTDANGASPQANGSVQLAVCPNGTTGGGICSTPASMTAPDVRLVATITDVRCRAAGQAACEGGALSDYTGELAAATTLRITDRHNSVTPGGSGDGATVTDAPFSFRLQCAANPGGASATAIGATCSTVTRLNAVIPGALLAGKRGNWELGQVAVHDGGSDGDVDTAGNGVFMRQGVFVP